MKKTLHLSKKIAVAISGGVDSSVAAYLLQKSHGTHNVFGLHMSNWNTSDEESESNYCEQSERDANDAQHVCDSIGIDMHRVEFVSEYWNGVFEPFVEALSEQRMINPDVGCNTVVKFGVMRDYAMKKGADYVATGHYARVWHRGTNDNNEIIEELDEVGANGGIENLIHEQITGLPEEEWIPTWGMNGSDNKNHSSPLLLAGADLSKDQSYFLCNVNSVGLSNAIFPLGDLIKKNQKDDDKNSVDDGGDTESFTVRDIAIEAGLPTASKKESMGICFIGKRKFPDFISQYLPEENPGSFVDIDTGEIVGKHNGSAHYTVGQGAKISGASRKWFITSKDPDGTVFVCDSTHHPSLYSNELYIKIEHFNWIGGELPPPMVNKGMMSIKAMCRTRHLQPLIPCNVSIDESHVIVKFDRPIRAVTPGQTCAVYVGNGLICLGGGQIWMHGPTYHELGLELPSKLHPAGSNDLSVNRRIVDAVTS